MSLRGAIASLAQGGPFTVTRTVEGSFDDAGVYQPGRPALTIADLAIEAVDAALNTLTITAHGLLTGDGPVRFTTTDTLPDGLELDTDYWLVKVDANTLKVTETLDDAMAVVPVVVDLADEGAGTHTLSDTTATTRSGASTFTIVASVQPVSGRELKDLPEGQRGDETRVIYTETELRTRKAGNDPDTVTLDGEPWTVIKVERFDAFGGTHYRAYAARTENP